MCGIFGLLNKDSSRHPQVCIGESFWRGKHRGPDASTLDAIDINTIFGFHRLAIQGVPTSSTPSQEVDCLKNPLHSQSNQPLKIDHITLICNGEIYNYKTLYKLMGDKIVPKTTSDCEVIIHLYKRYGMEETLAMLDGDFAFSLCDSNPELLQSRLFLARDPYGVRPLYLLSQMGFGQQQQQHPLPIPIYAFASEIKMLTRLQETQDRPYRIACVRPGTYTSFLMKYQVAPYWEIEFPEKVYHIVGNNIRFHAINPDQEMEEEMLSKCIRDSFVQAVQKRCFADREIGCLLSGGLDSSLTTALVQKTLLNWGNQTTTLKTFSIGIQGSVDLQCARTVATCLGTDHTEIALTEQDFVNAIEDVIVAVETYDTTTVRASIGNYLLGKYIAQHTNIKVVINGDGSDELAGGYLYMKFAKDALEFEKESRRLLSDIHMFDVQRSERCMSSHGLESRSPFLDRGFIQTYFTLLSPEQRFQKGKEVMEKYWIRKAFAETSLLPPSILWRRKEAFSDGVSGSQERSLYQVLQEHIVNVTEKSTLMSALDLEKRYYKTLFIRHFGEHNTHLMPYYWVPKYLDDQSVEDPSARSYSCLKESGNFVESL